MPTLKKPFSLLLILSHLSAFALGGVGNVYAVNQEVNTAKSLQTFVNVATNGVLNISSVQDSKSVQMKSSAKGLFSSSVSATTKATTNNIASNLTANNLTIETTKEDINITGSNIDAQQQL
ncbi:hemagglutinin repeat-containing protein, partial [bacterium endosymbiont of Bathymodiolus sp. 5 South]|uniref:hemagglutinin repeat-containing protein n=1 Tax=bacterium endosymbiont of Bathymodiolus sp. 5 South TaxID=1181670 RepID=UPI00111B19B1